MPNQTRIHRMRFLAGTMLLLLVLGGIYYWQAVGADLSNPHANFWRAVTA